MKRKVLISGSSHGIGAATAVAFAREGCDVGINYCTNHDGALETAEKCRQYGADVHIYQCDIGQREQALKMMEDFINDFGKIDVLINNAGGALKMPKGEFCDMPLDYWDSQIAMNLSGMAYLSHEAIKDMKKNGTEGRIVNISSIHGKVTWVKRKALPYCSAKGGMEMFTKAVGVEIAKHGIRMNCVAPGLVMTGIMSRYTDRDREGFRRKIPAGIFGTPEDIVPMILFLSDIEKTRYLVGQTITIDGGQSIDGAIDCMLEDEF